MGETSAALLSRPRFPAMPNANDDYFFRRGIDSESCRSAVEALLCGVHHRFRGLRWPAPPLAASCQDANLASRPEAGL